MSLAPAERQALARIEDSLRRSDPRLASMLTRFRLPLLRGGLRRRLPPFGGGWRRLTRRLRRRLGPLIVLVVTLTVVTLLVVAAVLSPGKSPHCSVRTGPGFANAVGRVIGCPPASSGGPRMARQKTVSRGGYQAGQNAPLRHRA